MTSAFTREQTGPTPTYRLLEAQAAKMGTQVWWTVRFEHTLQLWVASAHYMHVTFSVATRPTMDESMRALLGKLFDLEGEAMS